MKNGTASEGYEDGVDDGGKLKPKPNQKVAETSRGAVKKRKAETNADTNAGGPRRRTYRS